jgi:hypothetical protein
MDEPTIFQITVAAPYAASVKESLDEAAAEAGVSDGFHLEEGDSNSPPSEMQFDPISIAVGLYVANLVLTAVGDLTVESVVRKLITKMKAKMQAKKKVAPAELPPARIVLLLPDMSEMYLDLTDADGVEVKLRKLADESA